MIWTATRRHGCAPAAAFRRSRLDMQDDEHRRLAAEVPLTVLTLPDLYRAGLDASDVERLADRWAPNDPLDTAGGPPGSAGADSAPSVGVGEPHSIDAMIEHASVIVCCGSGGVGKTTTAAAIGLEAAAAGRRVVVVTIDPARRLADALGLADGLAAAPQRIELPDPGVDGVVGGEMWAMMLDAEATFDDLVRREAGDDEQVDRILSNRFYRNIAGALSGTQEYMASEMLHQLHVDERFDLVVVDTPPSRNALDFLEAPGVLARFLDHRVFKLMMLPTKGGLKIIGTAAQPLLRAIGKVVGSDVLADSVAFFQAFAGMEAGFRERAGAVMALIRADATSFVIVTSPHHDTIEEAVWFAGQLADQGVGHDGAGAEIVIVNRVHPAFGPGSADDAQVAAESAATDGAEVLAALWRNVAELRAARERELVVVGPLQELVSSARLAFVPLLDRDVHDLDGLRSIAGHLWRHRPLTSPTVHILIATDAEWIVDDITAALGSDDTSFTICRDGRVVAKEVAANPPDLAVFDLQIGSMGGMAVTMSLRLDESAGVLPRVRVLMLLDRSADLHLARRCGADGWLIKPLDSLRLRRAADAIRAGGRYTEGLAADAPVVDPMVDLGSDGRFRRCDNLPRQIRSSPDSINRRYGV